MSTTFTTLLAEQIRHEFTASQQYIAVAVWFDSRDLLDSPPTSTSSPWRSGTTR